MAGLFALTIHGVRGVEIMLKIVRKTRRAAWNFQRILGSFTMILEFFTGQWKRGFKKVGNKFIGRNIVRRIFFK